MTFETRLRDYRKQLGLSQEKISGGAPYFQTSYYQMGVRCRNTRCCQFNGSF